MLELVPYAMRASGTHSMLDYWRLAIAVRAGYFRSLEKDARECRHLYWRTCGSVTVNVPRLVAKVRLVVDYLRGADVPVDAPPGHLRGRNEK